MTVAPQPTAEIPSHVAAHLVRDFDIWTEISSAGADAFKRAADLHGEMPPIFYIPKLGYMPGAWVPRRAEDLRRILLDTETFSSGSLPFAQMLGEDWKLIPLEIDPPEHAKYRALINTLFSPKRIDELEPTIRLRANELIDQFAANGRCDFNGEFADWYPTLVFLRFMGWPTEEAPTFVRWTHTLIKSMDPQEVLGALKQIRDYLRERIAERRVNPGDDFTGYLLASEVDGRRLTDDEIFGMCFLIFIGGLDTVASSLGFHFMHLARHPEQQAELRAHPERIPNAVEELLRSYSIVNMRRVVTTDVQIGEATMRRGDYVLISTELGNLDPAAFGCPAHVKFDREDAHVHMAFSYGPHRCVGSHLARRELRIALELWMKRIPTFRMTGDPVQVRASGVFGVSGLQLEWDPAQVRAA
jgi:cytochrome P450